MARPLRHRVQEGLRGVPAHAAPLINLEVAHALVVAAVEIVGGRDAGLLCGGREGVQDLPAQALALDAPFAARAMRRVGAAPVVFMAHEVRQAMLPAPGRVARQPGPLAGEPGLR